MRSGSLSSEMTKRFEKTERSTCTACACNTYSEATLSGRRIWQQHTYYIVWYDTRKHRENHSHVPYPDDGLVPLAQLILRSGSWLHLH